MSDVLFCVFIFLLNPLNLLFLSLSLSLSFSSSSLTPSLPVGYKSESEKLIEGPPLFVVKIDKRKTLGDLKELLAEKINLEPLFFKVMIHTYIVSGLCLSDHICST